MRRQEDSQRGEGVPAKEQPPSPRKHHPFKIRTITCFVTLNSSVWTEGDEREGDEADDCLEDPRSVLGVFRCAVEAVWRVRDCLTGVGYEVQTVRVATNPFPEWLFGQDKEAKDDENSQQSSSGLGGQQGRSSADVERTRRRLRRIDSVLEERGVFACALGPATNPGHLWACREILQVSKRFSCSASLRAADPGMAADAARCILDISRSDPLSNFNFCVTSATAKPYIPFFPASCSPSIRARLDHELSSSPSPSPAARVEGFAIGLENGEFLCELLRQAGSIGNLETVVRGGMIRALEPLVQKCRQAAEEVHDSVTFLGVDVSINPSLDPLGSVASALEELDEVKVFGGPGTLAAAAAITTTLQKLPDNTVPRVGYCGLMLPLCEDTRLAELASRDKLRIQDLLSVSHVCGVGVDTVPIAGNVDPADLAGMLLDVAGVAERWDKGLSCRVFPVPGKEAGDLTAFDFPHLVNSKVMPLY